MPPSRTPVSIHHLALVDKLRKSGLLKKPALEAAFKAVSRHLFLPHHSEEVAYADQAVALKTDSSGLVVSSASQPTMMAIMLDQLDLQQGDNVLEIGTASGYNAALMQHIVGRNGRVTSVEIDKDLADSAKLHLRDAGYAQVQVVYADGVQGYAPRAAYDRIIGTAGVWDVPATWIRQLKPRGRIVAPIWIDGVQVSAVFEMQADGTLLSVDNRPCAFVYLRGEAAGPNLRKTVGSTALTLFSDTVAQIDTVALHTLLSDDQETGYMERQLPEVDLWYGFQLYVMINEPPDMTFALFAIEDDRQAYGMQGRGLALLAPASAVFLPYRSKGLCYSFAGADAYLELQRLLDEWLALGQPRTDRLRLRLIPKLAAMPENPPGKLYQRRDHVLHAWLDLDA